MNKNVKSLVLYGAIIFALYWAWQKYQARKG